MRFRVQQEGGLVAKTGQLRISFVDQGIRELRFPALELAEERCAFTVFPRGRFRVQQRESRAQHVLEHLGDRTASAEVCTHVGMPAQDALDVPQHGHLVISERGHRDGSKQRHWAKAVVTRRGRGLQLPLAWC